jgi:hypothetical protein
VTEGTAWRRCSACKNPIALGARYWTCSVSTCNRNRTALAFCSVECWDVHLPIANHREAWAIEQTAPASATAAPPASAESRPGGGQRRLVRTAPAAPGAAAGASTAPAGSAPSASRGDAPKEILVIASRLKDYIRARSGFNTSDGVLEPISDIVRELCDRAMEKAGREGRKTVLDRDVPWI